jgi:hypothetical protein
MVFVLAAALLSYSSALVTMSAAAVGLVIAAVLKGTAPGGRRAWRAFQEVERYRE